MRPGTREAAGARASWEPAASDLAPDVLADVGDLLLRLALDLVDAALDVGRVVVGQVAPGLLDLALGFVEDAFGALLGGGPLAVHVGTSRWADEKGCRERRHRGVYEPRARFVPGSAPVVLAGAEVVDAEAVHDAGGDVVGEALEAVDHRRLGELGEGAGGDDVAGGGGEPEEGGVEDLALADLPLPERPPRRGVGQEHVALEGEERGALEGVGDEAVVVDAEVEEEVGVGGAVDGGEADELGAVEEDAARDA